MSDVLEFVEKRRTAALPRRVKGDRIVDDERATLPLSAKRLYFLSVKWLSMQHAIRGGRFVHGRCESTAAPTQHDFMTTLPGVSWQSVPKQISLWDTITGLATRQPSPAPLELRTQDIDPDEVAKFFSRGGRTFVVRLWRQLKRKQIPDEALRALLEAFDELTNPKQREQSAGRRRADQTAVTPESFVLHASRLERAGHRNAAMDLLYDRIDDLMRTGQLEFLDLVLQRVPAQDLPVDVLLGLLTATLPAKPRLPSRAELFTATERTLKERGEYEEGLLTGLE